MAGTPAAPEPDRRIIAVLLADLKGYSQLPDQPRERLHLRTDEDTAPILRRYRTLTQKGTGDGVLVSFTDVRQAANCAFDLSTYYRDLDWHELEVPRLEVRIALHCGPATLHESKISGQPDLIGNAVIEAARTEPIVTPGEVWATDAFTTQLELRNQDERFAWDDLGEHELAREWGARRLYRLSRASGPSDGARRQDRVPAAPQWIQADLLAYAERMREEHSFINPSGIMQTERQVQVKMDDVFVPLHLTLREPEADIAWLLIEKERAAAGGGSGDFERDRPEEADLTAPYRFALRRSGQEQVPTAAIMPFEQALARHGQLVVLGEPGAGKTTLLRYLAYRHASALVDGSDEADGLGSPRFPIHVRLADYARAVEQESDELSLQLHILRRCQMRQIPLPEELLEGQLQRGNCIVLFDGLDEAGTPARRAEIAEQVEAFIRAYGGENVIIVSSRIASWRAGTQLVGDVTVATLAPLDDDGIARFLDGWCLAVEQQQRGPGTTTAQQAGEYAEAIKGALANNPGIRQLAANPLLLTILVLIQRREATLPEQRAALYDRIAETMIVNWRQRHVGELPFDQEEARMLLSHLGYRLHERRPDGMLTQDELVRLWAQRLAKDAGLPRPNVGIRSRAAELVQGVREHVGLLAERGEGLYGFSHRTFQEYFAGLEMIADSMAMVKHIRGKLHQPAWREPILLAVGRAAKSLGRATGDGLVSAIWHADSEYETIIHRDLLLALYCLSDMVEISSGLTQQLVDALAGLLLDTPNWRRYSSVPRIRTLLLTGQRALRSVGLPERLMARLEDVNESVRWSAAEALGRLGDGQAVPALMARLEDEDESDRRSAAEALGWLGDGQAVPALMARLEDEDESDRRSAAEALGWLGDGQAVPALMARLEEKNQVVRWSAAEALWQLCETQDAEMEQAQHGHLLS